MADTKITALAAIGANPINVATFPIPMVDLLDNSMAASGTTKKVTVNQILGAGGTATLASATITGDLTVDTSTLKVDSTNNRVGINIATPGAELHVIGGANFSDGTTTLRAVSSGNVAFLGTTTTDPLVLRVNTIEQYRIAQLGVFTWSDGAGGTRMTLDSTGLGVGVVAAAAKLQAAASALASVPAAGATGHMLAFGSVPYGIAAGALTNGNSYIQVTRWDGTATNYDLLIQPNGGNVGIGVTPSYKLDTQVAGGADRSILRAAVTGVSGGFNVSWNHATLKTRVIIENIPTSSAGLATGTLWNDAGTIKIA